MSFQLIILGGGRMGGALARGLLDARWCEPSGLAVVELAEERRRELTDLLPGVTVLASLEIEHVGDETGVVIAVKPDDAEATTRLAGGMGARRVLSLVAGLSTGRLESVLPEGAAVVRAMPNTPVLVGKGVSAIAGGTRVTKADLDWAEGVLGAVGLVVRVSEKNIDAVTGVSGSGPAYLFLVAEAMIEAGVHQGLTRDMSRKLVAGTFEGAGALLATGVNAEDLRSQVTSPGGTTAAGLRMLEGRAVRAAFLEAVAASAERSRSMGR